MKRTIRFFLTLALALTLALPLPAAAYDSARPGVEQTLSGGASESFFIDGAGNLWAWGDNQWGQLGDGTQQSRTTPVKVLDNVRSVSAGQDHTYAVRNDNTLWAWGRNVSNSFPDSDLDSSAVPIQIMEDVSSASTGVCTHLAVKTDGTLWAWGKYVGDRTTKQRSSPVKIMSNVAAACTGYGHSLALQTDGSLWAWGLNTDGAVGDGTGRERPTPVKVLDNVVQMSAGFAFSAAVTADGSLYTWGANGQGELGDGTLWPWGVNWEWTSPDPEENALLQATLSAWIAKWGSAANRDHSVPTKVLDRVSGVYASNNNGYALRTDGTLWAWGNNGSGDIGDGTTEDRLSPVQVLDNVSKVSVGWDHVLAQKTDGSLWTWGANVCGQLGNGESGFYGSNFTIRFSAFPLQIMTGTNTSRPTVSLTAGSSPSGWASAAVDESIANGFLPVSLRTRYGQTITRAEFCALAVQFYERFTMQEADRRVTFSDTSDPNVEKAAGLGIVSGVGGGRFAPNDPLNREQAAVILVNLAKAVGTPLPASAPRFDDLNTVSTWARDAVGQVQGAGVMSGTAAGIFSPQDTYTREQSAVTIVNLYHFFQS